MRTKLRDWAVWQSRAGCYSRAALSSNDSKTLYRVFPGQGEAIAFANSENGRDANNATTCSVFAAELDRSGRRQFIVCHREKMWSVVQELRPDRQVDFSQ